MYEDDEMDYEQQEEFDHNRVDYMGDDEEITSEIWQVNRISSCVEISF